MAHVDLHADGIELESPVLVEGLPGVGLVGKIATDHLVDAFDMTHYATCRCEGLPDVAVYREDDAAVRGPVRIYADEERDLLALQSDVPVSPNEASEFAACLSGWLAEIDAFPLYLSGLPAEKDGMPKLHGVATGDARSRLDEHDIDAPSQSGLVSGPTGALLAHAERMDLDGVGLVIESNAQFPDPESARVLITDAIAPLADVDVDTQKLVDQAEEIAEARQQLAQQMSQQTDESSQAKPLGMFQ
ncbi:proteasome assembly chaperone family protein [Halorientalis brevis]|uniref:Proteasome assembly chaperone family protein n=1 Tax=Halorientalis brevis TaxID=1126241 RepID=A0ABD6CA98_9EURY|nr:PAC2 family protein [Halorientalis brevis]